MLPLNTNYYNRAAVSVFFFFFISSTYTIPAVVFTSGHCHHLSVECLALVPTGKSRPPLHQEMQEAFRPEHMRQEAECARVDFPCPSLEQDLKDGKMMTMTSTLHSGFFCIVALAAPVLLLYLFAPTGKSYKPFNFIYKNSGHSLI